jgi:3-hydroxyacyl-CoA dehydrogenase/enoyl-CoA hydratase/3-hydroxybutyryl-CoA epimerase
MSSTTPTSTTWQIDRGIAIATLGGDYVHDSRAWLRDINAVAQRLHDQSERLRGAVLVIGAAPVDPAALVADSAAFGADLRKLERLGRPLAAVVAESTSVAGLAVALACHHRTIHPDARLDTTALRSGWLPAGGVITRLVRLLGVEAALEELLLIEPLLNATDAFDLGVIDRVASSLEDACRWSQRWVESHADGYVQAWDTPNYRLPGGQPYDAKLMSDLPLLIARQRKLFGAVPPTATHHAICAAAEGASVDVDTALVVEQQYMTDLCAADAASRR